MRQFKIIVEKHSDGYVAYPLGLKGVVVGQGDTYEVLLGCLCFFNICYISFQFITADRRIL